MTNPLHNEFARTTADLEQAVARLTALQQQLQESTYSATDRNRHLTVEVSSTGELTDIRFLGNAYRKMAPAELSKLLVETTRQARAKALESMISGLTGVLPHQLPLEQILAGDTPLDEIVAASMAEYEKNMPEMLRSAGGAQ
jgi:DNA-binding protein YbaB